MFANLTAVYERGEKYYIGYCPEVPGANGQGRTLEECRESLIEAVRLILQGRLVDTIPRQPNRLVE